MPTSNPELQRLEERVNQSRDNVFKLYSYWPSRLEEMRRQMTTASAIAQLIMSGPGDIQSGFWKMVDLGIAKTESLEAIVLEYRISGLFTNQCIRAAQARIELLDNPKAMRVLRRTVS
jgi:hypothetical protein